MFNNTMTNTETSEKYIYDLEQLLQISESLSSSLNITQILDSLVNICLTHGMVQEAGIFIADKKGVFHLQRNNTLVVRGDKNYIDNEHHRSFLHSVITVESIFNYRDHEIHIPLLDSLDIHYILPILYKQELLGFIVLKDPIIDDHLNGETTRKFLNQIGRMSAIALKNAQLYEMATTDMMTSLKQKYFFKNHINYYMDSYPGKRFVIISLDLDHFKKINDNYGHAAGDLVLVSVARQMLKHTRPQDVSGRLGGEEFALFLENTTLEQGLVVAGRLRKEIEDMTIYSSESESHIKVTASLGISLHKRDESLETMLERCDKALYLSKKNGRNQVTSL